jgi:superfamily II DNA or RNA helicase
MNETTNLVEKLISERNLIGYPYVIDTLTNPMYVHTKKPFVLAAGTSAGKTIISFLWLEAQILKGSINLAIPSSRTVLRDNYEEELKKFNPSFTYKVCSNKSELQDAIDEKVELIIALPQTLNGNYHLLSKVNTFILDEAHQWYFNTTIQKIIKHIKPKKQLLLTGTPSKFIAQKDKFEFKFVPVMDLYDLGQVGNVKVEVVSSSYDFKQTDWLSVFGNLRSNRTSAKKPTEEALEVVCKEMLKKLKNPIKGLHGVNNITGNTIGSLFNYLDKTIIYVHSLTQADIFTKILNTTKGLEGKVLCSHSENDKDSEFFKQFKTDSNIKILVAVDRGRLGFNMPEMFNIVDFTLTQSLDMLLQMFGRLLRKSELQPNKPKIYFKVATKNTANYFVDLMTAMLCLTNMEWYSKFNGKNMGDIKIPKVLLKSPRKTSGGSSSKSKPLSNRPRVNITELGIPLDLNIFNENVLHSSDGKFDTIAWTTLEDVKNEFFNINNYSYTKTELINIVKNASSKDELKKRSGAKLKWSHLKYICIETGKREGFDGEELFNQITVKFDAPVTKRYETKQDVVNEVERGIKTGEYRILSDTGIGLRQKIKKYNLVDKFFSTPTWKINPITNEKLEKIVSKMKNYNEFYNSKYFGVACYRKLNKVFKQKYFTIGVFDKTKWDNVNIKDVIDFCKKYDKPYHMAIDKTTYNFSGIETKAKPIMRIAEKNNLFDKIWPNRSKIKNNNL